MTTDYLFTRPSFLEGIARILDFGNILDEYNFSRSGAIADYRAMQADWQAVANDLRYAFQRLELEIGPALADFEARLAADDPDAVEQWRVYEAQLAEVRQEYA